MSVKGSWSRVRDAKAFGENYDGIFRKARKKIAVNRRESSRMGGGKVVKRRRAW
jgi:hypothetical protein